MADLTPNNREEAWLKGMVDGSTTLTPNNRREHWYQEIVNAGGGGGGGGGGVLVVGTTMTETSITLDKTWKEIKDAPFAVIVVDADESKFHIYIGGMNSEVGLYAVLAFSAGIGAETVVLEPIIFTTTSENGYPSADIPE